MIGPFPWQQDDPTKPGTWTNGKRTVTGRWIYVWASQRFVIWLDSRDRVTGANRRIVTANDTPEWGNWKLKRD